MSDQVTPAVTSSLMRGLCAMTWWNRRRARVILKLRSPVPPPGAPDARQLRSEPAARRRDGPAAGRQLRGPARAVGDRAAGRGGAPARRPGREPAPRRARAQRRAGRADRPRRDQPHLGQPAAAAPPTPPRPAATCSRSPPTSRRPAPWPPPGWPWPSRSLRSPTGWAPSARPPSPCCRCLTLSNICSNIRPMAATESGLSTTLSSSGASARTELVGPGTTLADERLLPVVPALQPLLPSGGLRRGTTVAVTSSAALALALVAGASAAGSWVAAVGLPDLGIVAAVETGIAP